MSKIYSSAPAGADIRFPHTENKDDEIIEIPNVPEQTFDTDLSVIEASIIRRVDSNSAVRNGENNREDWELIQIPVEVFELPALASLELCGPKVIGFAEGAEALNPLLGRPIRAIGSLENKESVLAHSTSTPEDVMYLIQEEKARIAKSRSSRGGRWDRVMEFWLGSFEESLSPAFVKAKSNSSGGVPDLSAKVELMPRRSILLPVSNILPCKDPEKGSLSPMSDSGGRERDTIGNEDSRDPFECSVRTTNSKGKTLWFPDEVTADEVPELRGAQNSLDHGRSRSVLAVPGTDLSQLTEVKFVEPYLTRDIIYFPEIVWNFFRKFSGIFIILCTLITVSIIASTFLSSSY